jgi:hypothetical protein
MAFIGVIYRVLSPFAQMKEHDVWVMTNEEAERGGLPSGPSFPIADCQWIETRHLIRAYSGPTGAQSHE